jgi:hypothetical protein
MAKCYPYYYNETLAIEAQRGKNVISVNKCILGYTYFLHIDCEGNLIISGLIR